MFEQHGTYWVGIDKEIILFEAAGEWNVEASNTCISIIKQLIDTLKGKKFGMLIDSREIKGITPDTFDAWINAIEYWHTKGHSATTRIDDPSSAYYKNFLSGFDDELKITTKFKFSNTVSDGIRWLNENGFSGFESGKDGIHGFSNR